MQCDGPVFRKEETVNTWRSLIFVGFLAVLTRYSEMRYRMSACREHGGMPITRKRLEQPNRDIEYLLTIGEKCAHKTLADSAISHTTCLHNDNNWLVCTTASASLHWEVLGSDLGQLTVFRGFNPPPPQVNYKIIPWLALGRFLPSCSYCQFRYIDKKFWEELIAHFNFIRLDRIENYSSDSFSLVALVLAAVV
jgi:hypothetical protein